MSKKSPLQRTKDEFGSKEKLVDKLVSVLSSIAKADEDKEDLKGRLLAASNKKLLKLFEMGSTVKEKYGSVEKLAEMPDWLSYDIPREIVGEAWKGRFRGQTQKWYALRFTGKDSEINIAKPPGGHKPEFIDWRWEAMDKLAGLIIPFKRPVYERVVQEFAKFAKA